VPHSCGNHQWAAAAATLHAVTVQHGGVVIVGTTKLMITVVVTSDCFNQHVLVAASWSFIPRQETSWGHLLRSGWQLFEAIANMAVSGSDT
jgi:hypothetical protein